MFKWKKGKHTCKVVWFDNGCKSLFLDVSLWQFRHLSDRITSLPIPNWEKSCPYWSNHLVAAIFMSSLHVKQVPDSCCFRPGKSASCRPDASTPPTRIFEASQFCTSSLPDLNEWHHFAKCYLDITLSPLALTRCQWISAVGTFLANKSLPLPSL